MSNIAIINDNNNFAPSIFRSFCEFLGDCFGLRYFFFGSYAPSEKYLGPTQSPPILYNEKDGAQLLLSNYCCLLKIPPDFTMSTFVSRSTKDNILIPRFCQFLLSSEDST